MDQNTKFNPQSAEVQFKLANIWQSKGKIDRAIAGYKKAIHLQPDYVPAHLELGNLFLQVGKIDEAIDVYRRAIGLNPNEKCFRKNLIDILARKERQGKENHISYQTVSIAQQGINTKLGHILLYTDCPGINGAGQCNHVLMLGFAGSGYRISCIQSQASDYLIDERERLGIRHIWIEDDDVYDATRIPLAFTNLSEAQSIFSIAKPDLIIFSDGCPLSNLAAKQVAIQLKIPYIVIVHCVTPSWARWFAPYLPKLPEIYRQAQAVVSVSEENIELLRSHFGLQENKGLVIHNGRPAQYFNDPNLIVRNRLRKELGISPSAVVSFTAARMQIMKGYQYQLKAIEQLKQRSAWSQLYFTWAGTGSLESQLRAIVGELGAADRVKFLGERSDIPDWLDAVDIFILPSLFEGMPLSIMEAMAKGLPVIATAVSGIPEELGETGKLLPNPKIDPEATVRDLITTIEAWTLDSKLRLAVGQSCKRRAERMFTAERMLEEYLRIIKRVLLSKESTN